MKTQKFFNINLIFTNQSHSLGRNVIEAWLQFFFNTDLKGKKLANSIGNKTIELVTINQSNKVDNVNWWEDCLLVKRINETNKVV
jgi:hypothetical protein